MDEEGKVALLLGKGVVICNRVTKDVGECRCERVHIVLFG